ncbi:MAG TPA: class I SAM-dependent methyltransferase [Gemmatimonadaceae bacterium]|nr:class I SAM-dependent methyltransferase [Gemmatimonadaceae bacterium]
MASFSDHFAASAASYASYRPSYPAALFDWLASVAPDRRLAWDCGTGSGQAAVALADYFAQVVATDPSTAQLEPARRHPRVRYVAMTAERAALAGASAGLITVAQALHWFDRPAFFAEARRVLVEQGVVAIWSYGLVTLGDERLDAAIRRFHGETVGPYWPPERRLVDEGYRAVELPFDLVAAPSFGMRADWTLAQLAGYLSTWSAVLRASAETGIDPLPALIESLRAAWGAAAVRRAEWSLTLKVGRKTSESA